MRCKIVLTVANGILLPSTILYFCEFLSLMLSFSTDIYHDSCVPVARCTFLSMAVETNVNFHSFL